MHPSERLLNLVALLLEAPRPVTFERIREVLPAYAQDDPQTAKRMFERDKDTLRDLGIPLELAPTDVWEVEEGYRIPKETYYLPEITFSPEEISALVLAAQAPGEDSLAEQAVRKLLSGVAASGLPTGAPPAAVGPEFGAPHLAALAEAIQGGRSVRFAYRTAQGEIADRHVDPYGLIHRSAHWYVVGRDRDRDELRAFRLSRIGSEVADAGDGSEPPEGFRAADHVRAGPWGPGEPMTTARVAFSPEIAWWALPGVPGADDTSPREDGWVEAAVPAATSDAFVSWVLSFGPDVEVLEPAELREAVVLRLESIRAG
jgi:proteasome accessory factor B